MAGIKETKDVLAVGFKVAEVLALLLKDGVQAKDGMALIDLVLTNADFQVKFKEAIAGIEQVPDELKEVSVFEGLELGQFALAQVKKIGDILA